MAEKEFTQGIDISTWQDDNSTPQRMDAEKSRDQGVKFVFIKSTERLGIDADFIWNWNSFKAAGILRGAYHFARPDVPARDQADFMWSVIKDDPGELPPVLDLEAPAIGTKSLGLSFVKAFLERLSILAGRPAILYTSNGFWNSIRDSANAIWALDYPLWIAWPLNISFPVVGIPPVAYTTTVLVPEPWKRKKVPFLIWQYSWVGGGKLYGAESKGLDLNVFNGSESELLAFANVAEIPDPGQPTDPGTPDPGQPPAQAGKMIGRVIADALNVRAGPPNRFGDLAAIVGDPLRKSAIVEIQDIGGNSVWVKIGEGRWAAMSVSSGKFIELI